ncbi:hypothetical protein MYCTH_2306233 [Thermothelomyces thermophilus ATCC 42464]|uniref:BZIP domain-containing protein n=1 Tax=Thermothelomyces thermophilus (strain ATCC 42464 / BCRC 31852 / DSM 1799) TaxID=573729 RepID=G2QH65_THET4|nr:uncharacterized protein MYCTH_2306233 [Thermothelomyces thermophilus ATCC 42464]AEO58725.1 hypothetical protein MYCTH_2306233 [Thermothelomyces thermophilus ATCC 42464]
MDSRAFRSHIRRFSCKPPGHDAARQRENQRRHRARVKSRIAELEAALSDAQARLDEALQRIDALTTEVQRLRALSPSSLTAPQPADRARLGDAAAKSELPESPGCCLCSQAAGSLTANAAPDSRDMFRTGRASNEVSTPQPKGQAETVDATAPPAMRSTEPVITGGTRGAAEPAAEIDLEDLNDDCALLPAPGEGESTIPCREAYSIIKEWSASSEFDLAVANEWLRPGFRRAIAPGTGCRVQTHILFAFVDHLTPG